MNELAAIFSQRFARDLYAMQITELDAAHVLAALDCLSQIR